MVFNLGRGARVSRGLYTNAPMSHRHVLVFEQPYRVSVHEEPLPEPGPGEVLVTILCSAISAGTEMLFYRGQVPAGMAVDASISGMESGVAYPLSYGYACVGRVTGLGPDADPSWLERLVFVFRPHGSHHILPPHELVPVPEGIEPEEALFLPNMETAVSLTMDARPLVGERVLVFGQGIVGLLLTGILARFPLGELTTVDGYAQRRSVSARWGAHRSLPPDELELLSGLDPDLILELSSNPLALDMAVQMAGFGTRIVVGSWYGTKRADLHLGGSFHRNRVHILSSQVSTLDGQHANRWTKARRLDTAWSMLRILPVQELITHRVPLAGAPEVYALLDQQPDEALQIVITY